MQNTLTYFYFSLTAYKIYDKNKIKGVHDNLRIWNNSQLY